MSVTLVHENGHATNILAVDLARENDRLAARVAELEAQLAAMVPNRVTIGDQVVDLTSGFILRDGQHVNRLTRTERTIVAILAAAPGVAIPYSRIRDAVWPDADSTGEAFQHMIRVNLSRIRSKLDRSPVRHTGRGTHNSASSRHFFVAGGFGVGITP